MRHALAAFILLGIAAHVACLKDLEEPTVCSPKATSEFCLGGPGGPGGPNPGPPGEAGIPGLENCNIATNECVIRRGGQCQCSSSDECKRTSATCFPVPTCPDAIRQAESNAQCIEVVAPPGIVGPGGPGGPPGSGNVRECICGCQACAATCDGRGPIYGGDSHGSFGLGDLGASGRLGAMLRARGAGIVVVSVRLMDGTNIVLGEVPGSGNEFSDVIARRPEGTTYTWSDERRRPVGLELQFGAQAQVELDCVIPWVTR